MKKLDKIVMLFGVIAMLGLSLLLCFTSNENEKESYTSGKNIGVVREP